MNCILFDDDSWENLLPLTFTRPVSEIRIGIVTITEKWKRDLQLPVSFLTKDYLSEKYKTIITADNYLVNGSVLPEEKLLSAITALQSGDMLVHDDIIIAARLNDTQTEQFINNDYSSFRQLRITIPYVKIKYPWDIFTFNELALHYDFHKITQGRTSAVLSATNQILGKGKLFVEEGARIECSVINMADGMVYIGKDTEIMEGCLIRGSFALCDHGVLKMGAKIYGATTIGPHCKVGGEVNNSVLFGYSSKAHDGFLGNSVLGEWCNLGAGTNNSNLKNNYAEIRVWNLPRESFIKTGLQFCGLIMGDHSKSAINTMFNTGTVVGISSNIFGAGFPRNFVPSFSFGGNQGFIEYKLNKVFEVAELVMHRRNMTLSAIEKQILTHIFGITAKYRNF